MEFLEDFLLENGSFNRYNEETYPILLDIYSTEERGFKSANMEEKNIGKYTFI